MPLGGDAFVIGRLIREADALLGSRSAHAALHPEFSRCIIPAERDGAGEWQVAGVRFLGIDVKISQCGLAGLRGEVATEIVKIRRTEGTAKVMLGVFINPGRRPDQPEPNSRDWGDKTTNRASEYIPPTDKYARVIEEELMPAFKRGITFHPSLSIMLSWIPALAGVPPSRSHGFASMILAR